MKEIKRIVSVSIVVILRNDGIVEIINNEEWNQPDTLEVAKKDTSIIKELIGDKPNHCILIEVPSRYASREVLQHYQSVELGEVARALLLNSFATKVVGNLYLKLSKGKPNEAGRVVPTKLFTKKEEAEKWLLSKINGNV